MLACAPCQPAAARPPPGLVAPRERCAAAPPHRASPCSCPPTPHHTTPPAHPPQAILFWFLAGGVGTGNARTVRCPLRAYLLTCVPTRLARACPPAPGRRGRFLACPNTLPTEPARLVPTPAPPLLPTHPLARLPAQTLTKVAGGWGFMVAAVAFCECPPGLLPQRQPAGGSMCGERCPGGLADSRACCRLRAQLIRPARPPWPTAPACRRRHRLADEGPRRGAACAGPTDARPACCPSLLLPPRWPLSHPTPPTSPPSHPARPILPPHRLAGRVRAPDPARVPAQARQQGAWSAWGQRNARPGPRRPPAAPASLPASFPAGLAPYPTSPPLPYLTSPIWHPRSGPTGQPGRLWHQALCRRGAGRRQAGGGARVRGALKTSRRVAQLPGTSPPGGAARAAPAQFCKPKPTRQQQQLLANCCEPAACSLTHAVPCTARCLAPTSPVPALGAMHGCAVLQLGVGHTIREWQGRIGGSAVNGRERSRSGWGE